MRGKRIFMVIVIAAAFSMMGLTTAAPAKEKAKSAKAEKSTSIEKSISGAGEAVQQAIRGKININQADLNMLTKLKGIGPDRAKAILDYRTKVGSFKKVEDLMKVKGIGKGLFEKIKPFISVK